MKSGSSDDALNLTMLMSEDHSMQVAIILVGVHLIQRPSMGESKVSLG